jgi:hypothetical protein
MVMEIIYLPSKLILVIVITVFLFEGLVFAQQSDISKLYYPTLVLGDPININLASGQPSHSPPTCISIAYNEAHMGNATLIWRYPENNIGSDPGRNLTGAAQLNFWARSSNTDPINVTFYFGIFQKDSYHATLPCQLHSNWRPYSIDLLGKNLTDIRGGFACRMNSTGVIYLDDIYYVLQ